MPSYEIAVDVRATAYMTVEADTLDEAIMEARETWSYSDLQGGEPQAVFVDEGGAEPTELREVWP